MIDYAGFRCDVHHLMNSRQKIICGRFSIKSGTRINKNLKEQYQISYQISLNNRRKDLETFNGTIQEFFKPSQ